MYKKSPTLYIKFVIFKKREFKLSNITNSTIISPIKVVCQLNIFLLSVFDTL
jgi:hypothetical protein